MAQNLVATYSNRIYDCVKNLVRRLIDRYYEGHSPDEKRTALEQLAKIPRQPDL